MIPLTSYFPPCQKVLLPHLSLSHCFLWSHCKPDQEKDPLLKTESFNLIIHCFHKVEGGISSDKKALTYMGRE